MIRDPTVGAPEPSPATPVHTQPDDLSHANGYNFTPSPASTASRSSQIDEVIDFLRSKQDLREPMNNMETAGIIAKLRAAGSMYAHTVTLWL
jgi:hypothetical protein